MFSSTNYVQIHQKDKKSEKYKNCYGYLLLSVSGEVLSDVFRNIFFQFVALDDGYMLDKPINLDEAIGDTLVALAKFFKDEHTFFEPKKDGNVHKRTGLQSIPSDIGMYQTGRVSDPIAAQDATGTKIQLLPQTNTQYQTMQRSLATRYL